MPRPHDPADTGAPETFPIVGIGASAGGLEAFTELLEHLPPDLGMGYVLVQHLDPKHRSILVDLLAGVTRMPVAEAADGMKVEPDHIYVIPPNTNLAILHGVLHLMPPAEARAPQLTVDYFLRSLGEDQRGRAIGIILSGTASDGVKGMKTIKAEGGITFAQDEKSAHYASMPQASIASGCVDFVLRPAEIARELQNLSGVVATRPVEPAEETETVAGDEREQLNKIFILLRRRTEVDFTHYKHTTIHRRIRRRMLVHRLDHMADYVRLLHDRPAEVDVLYSDILINVTAFFRDPEAFDIVVREVFPKLVASGSGNGAIRIWVPGCSTGEEPYSLAIALLEYMDRVGTHLPIQIFATDIDLQAIDAARAGIYPESIAADVSATRLARFFTRVDRGYQISKQIRDLCLFAKQDVVKDPPFSRLDLVSCRNVLIYLGPVLQKKVLGLFHYALKPGGFLLLGVAETIGKHGDLFRAVDAKHKLYGKKTVAARMRYDFAPPPVPVADFSEQGPKGGGGLPMSGRELSKLVDRTLMKKYCPASVLINEQLDILQFRGQTGDFLEPAPGEASFNLLRMARDGLAMELRDAVAQAARTHAVVRRENIHVPRGEGASIVEIEVSPLEFSGSNLLLVVFRSMGAWRPAAETDTPDVQRQERILLLEQELSATREYLQSVIEQDETINEELRSANEEILSSNEELQSTNEELETAKEELQSVNEELSTVNDELETRNGELMQVNNDLSNLIGSVNIPIVILGADLRIRRFTPLAEKQLKLVGADVGRPIGEIPLGVPVDGLRQVLDKVVSTATEHEIEGQAHDGRWYSIRVRPYRTLDNRIEGAVVAFIDIDDIRRGLSSAQQARDYALGIVNAIRDPILVLDANLRVVSANPAFLSTFGVDAQDTEDNLVHHLGNGQWAIPRLRKALEAVSKRGEGFDGFAVEHEFEHIGWRSFRVSGRPIGAGGEPPYFVLMQIGDAPQAALPAAGDADAE